MYSAICVSLLGLGGEWKLSVKQQKRNCEIGFTVVSPAFWAVFCHGVFCVLSTQVHLSCDSSNRGSSLSRQPMLKHEYKSCICSCSELKNPTDFFYLYNVLVTL